MKPLRSITRICMLIIIPLAACKKNNNNPSKQNLYVEVIVDGVTYNYVQYGFNGNTQPNSSDAKIANCGTNADGELAITGIHLKDGSSVISSFVLEIDKPVHGGTASLSCTYNNGNDDVSFQLVQGQKVYSNNYVARAPANQNCTEKTLCSNFSVTFIDYQNTSSGNVRGYFSGVLYEPAPNNSCQSDIPHVIEGEFWLKRAD